MKWLKYRWGDKPVDDLFQYYSDNYFLIDYSNIRTDVGDPFEETQNLIKHIAETCPPPYNLFVSGGIDSQAMLYAWQQSKIPFRAYSFVYNKNYNEHDITTLRFFSKKHNIKIHYVDIDVFNFLEKDLITYSRRYVCNSPQITLYMRFSEIINNGTKIYSGDQSGDLDYTILGLYRFALKNNADIIPFFFHHTESIAGSFSNAINHAMKDDFFHYVKGKTYQAKAYIYNLQGFDVIPTKKFSGFEGYKKYYDDYAHLVSPKMRLRAGNFASKRIFDLLFRYPLFEINNYNDHTGKINHPFSETFL